MADFQSWLKRNKIGLFDTFLTRGGGGKRSRMSTRPMMWEDEALEKFTGEKYNNAMLQRGISEAVGRAFGDDRRDQLARENAALRSTIGQYRQATGGLARDLQRVGGEKQGVTSPELDPYQMARQIPWMEGRKALTSGAAGGGGMDLVGMGLDEPTNVEPVTASTPGLTTGEALPLAPIPTEDESITPMASGGPLQRGAVHMVGEAGRELVVPRGDGGYQVIPHRMTEAVMARNPQMRVEGHEDGGEIYANRRYDEVIGPEIQGTPVYNPDRELRPMENINTILGRNQVATNRVEETYPVGPVPESGMGWSRRAGVVPGAGTALPPVTSVHPGMATTPEAYTAATEAARGMAGAGAETDRPLGRSYYDEMASQWNKPMATTAAPAAAPPTSAQLARTRPVTLIRGTNVTYANPSVTGEQEFSTPQMAREAAMYTPEAQAEMFELKRQAARQGVKNLSTSPVADARMYAAMARENSAWGRANAQVEATSAKENNGIPTLTLTRDWNTIVHPRHLPQAISNITSAAPKVKTVNEGIQLAEQIRRTVAGHDPATMNSAFEALLGPKDNPGAGALPANVAKQVREYYARLRQQAAAQQTR